jgi:hypothetical protein
MVKEEKKVNNPPVAKGNSFGVSTAIWDNVNKAGVKYQSLSISVSSKDKENEGQYKTRTILFPSDLENLITALTELKANADEQGIQTAFKQK